MSGPSRPRGIFVAVLAGLAIAVGLTGCMSSIGPSVAGRDELGPFPRDYEHIVRRWIEDEFPDYSRIERLQMGRPQAGVSKPPRLSLRGTRYGWYTQVTFFPTTRVNAPSGEHHYAVLIREGKVVSHQKLLFRN